MLLALIVGVVGRIVYAYTADDAPDGGNTPSSRSDYDRCFDQQRGLGRSTSEANLTCAAENPSGGGITEESDTCMRTLDSQGVAWLDRMERCNALH